MGSESQFEDNSEVAGFLDDVRTAYVRPPEEAVAARHLAAIAREAELVLDRRTPKPTRWRRIMSRSPVLRPAAALGAATVTAVLASAGLAAAGVDLPDPATAAFERAGITLPNQAGGPSGEHGRSADVRSVIEATPPSDRGCAFGHSVAEAAKGSALPEHASAACDREEESKTATQHGASDHNQFGKDTADAAHGQRDATVDQRRSFGQETSDRARDLGGPPDNVPHSRPAPEQRPVTPPEGGSGAPPAGAPAGPPESTPGGQPDTLPVPEGTPTGPPDGTPSGKPDGTPGGRP
jgi:hypothetical protein